MIELQADSEELKKIQRYASDSRFQELVKKALTGAGLELENKIVENVYERASNTGRLGQSWNVKAIDYKQVKVFSNLLYAPFVEYGTKPHRPPIEPIYNWVRQKFQTGGEEARGIAWAVWNKIAEKGTPEKRYVRDAISSFNLDKWLKELIRNWESEVGK